MADSSTPTPRIVQPEEIVGALEELPGDPWPIISGDWFRALCASHEALRDAVAVLTEERDAYRQASEDNVRALNDAEAEVAVLKAGLRDWLDATEAAFRDEPGAYRAVIEARARCRDLLGGVSAAAPEPSQLTVRYVSTESVESVVNGEPEHCGTCGSADRAVFGPLCAIFGRFGAESDAWHGGETPS